MNPALMHDVYTGRKVVTIRAGRRDYPLGDAVIYQAGALGSRVPVIITRIHYSTLWHVSDHDMRCDGFAGRVEMKNVLNEFYPDLGWNDEVTEKLVINYIRCALMPVLTEDVADFLELDPDETEHVLTCLAVRGLIARDEDLRYTPVIHVQNSDVCPQG